MTISTRDLNHLSFLASFRPAEVDSLDIYLGDIVVRDPPKHHLPGSFERLTLLARYPQEAKSSQHYISPTRKIQKPHPAFNLSSYECLSEEINMAKKRRSLQSILVPSFFQQMPSSVVSPTTSASPRPSRMRSHSSAEQSLHYHSAQSSVSETPSFASARDSPPPDFLLDDDPFADLSSRAPAQSSSRVSIITLPKSAEATSPPRSPLTPATPDMANSLSSFYAHPPVFPQASGVSRAISSGRGHPRPAYQRPAFAPRPSLPSLDTLARMNVVVPKKVRKGRVGAHLPYEPWDINLDSPATSSDFSTSQPPLESTSPANPSQSDFLADLDFMDFSDDYEDDLEPSLGFQSEPDDEGYTKRPIEGELPQPPSPASSSEFPTSLSRSISPTSNSSSGSESSFCHQDFQCSNYGGNAHTPSSSVESEELNSPPDDYFYFPSSRHPPDYSGSDPEISTLRYEDHHFDDTSHASVFSDPKTVDESELMYQPGTSAGTIRSAIHAWTDRGRPLSMVSAFKISDDPVDGGDERHGGTRQGYSNRSGQTSGGGGGGGGRGSALDSGGTSSGSGGGMRGDGGREGDDDDGREDKRRPAPGSSFFSSSSCSDTSDDELEESTDDYGEPATAAPSGATSGSDDDIPLAQRIPTALTAQRTIRRQVREERDQRRKERAIKAQQAPSLRSRQVTLRPVGAGASMPPATISSTPELAPNASTSTRRSRTQTLPGNTTRPFTPEDLVKKLQTVQVAEKSSRHQVPPLSWREMAEQYRVAGRDTQEPPYSRQVLSRPASPPQQEGFRTLRPMRSFHRPEGRYTDEHHHAPMPADAEHKLGRSLTRAKSKRRDEQGSYTGTLRSFAQGTGDGYYSGSHRTGEERRKMAGPNPEVKSTRTSAEATRPNASRPPVPAFPVADTPSANSGLLTQQRVFVGDMQRFNMVEISNTTSAGDVVAMVEAQGTLNGWVGSGGWMIWEIAQDFGMERPIRNFELLSDVQASWNKDKMVNAFMVKLTPLAALLSRRAIPSSSPIYSGYVEWESKRGKWNKRWMQLREHSLWLSKRDNGKDEVFLCSLSNFDAYSVTRLHKAPKSFVFAVKSTDNLSFFENTADYLHVFSCSDKEGSVWMEKILLARSYVLHQERNVLFNPKASGGNAAGTSGHLSRSGTRKVRPVQPLVAVAAPYAVAPNSSDVFEPGSLLHKHI